MAEKKGFDLGDYIEVKDRIRVFYELYGQGRLVTGEVRLTTEPDGKPRVMVQGLAYRTPEDPLPGVGWSWLELPGTTPYTKGSEIENAETSAWGRAIGSLGILIERSIASAQEVKNKEGAADIPPTDPADETLRPLGPIERVGAIAKGTGRHSDMEWRQTPDGGYRFGFLLEGGGGKVKPQVIVEGPLAFALFTTDQTLIGLRVTVKGDLFEVHVPKRKTIYRIHATSLETDEWTLPAKVEAESESLGLVEDDLSDLPDGAWVANEASDAGSRR